MNNDCLNIKILNIDIHIKYKVYNKDNKKNPSKKSYVNHNIYKVV